MAYNESVAQRLRESFLELGIPFSEKKMFGGICLMVNDKMCVCTKTGKADGEDHLLCRISDEDYQREIESPHTAPMQLGKTVMANFLYVYEKGFDSKPKLDRYLQLCLKYNPLAKKSAK